MHCAAAPPADYDHVATLTGVTTATPGAQYDPSDIFSFNSMMTYYHMPIRRLAAEFHANRTSCTAPDEVGGCIPDEGGPPGVAAGRGSTLLSSSSSSRSRLAWGAPCRGARPASNPAASPPLPPPLRIPQCTRAGPSRAPRTTASARA